MKKGTKKTQAQKVHERFYAPALIRERTRREALAATQKAVERAGRKALWMGVTPMTETERRDFLARVK